MAQLKNTTISDTGSIDLPVGTTGQRPGSPIAAMIRYNTTLSETEYYDGTAWRPLSDSNPEATGGTIVDTDIGGVPYRIHYFTNTGNTNFVVTKGGEVEYLIVAGGGGGGTYALAGGQRASGGGGAGGLVSGSFTAVVGSYTVTVGPGGTATTSNSPATNSGGNSVLSGPNVSVTAIGGGGGRGNRTVGLTGGSGGGTGSGDGNRAAGLGTSGQGNASGSMVNADTILDRGAAGGGGSGGAGESVGPDFRGAGRGQSGGNGGAGSTLTITGSPIAYAGGGGGAGDLWTGAPNGPGGFGAAGGGRGGGSNNLAGGNATANSGSGGGGGGGNSDNPNALGGNGGSGIVVIRYRRNATTATNPDRIESSTLPNNLEITNSGLVFFVDPNNPNSWNGSTLTDIAQGKAMTLGANTVVETRLGTTHFSSTAGDFGSGTLDTGVRFGSLPSGDRVVRSDNSWTAISTIFKASTSNPNNWWHIFTDGLSGDIFTIFTDGSFRTSMNQATFNGTFTTGGDFTYSGVNWATMKLGWNFFGVEYDRDNSQIRCFVDNGSLIYSSYATGRIINNDFRLRNFHGWGSANSAYHSDASHGPTLIFQRRLLDGEVKDIINKLRIKYNGLS